MLKRSFVLGALALSIGVIPSCGGDDDGPPTKLAEPCHANSDCGGTLICALGKCHVMCANSKDCPVGQRCVKTDTSTACQLPAESKCVLHSECSSPLVCGIDRSCRNQCMADRDCLSGQICDPSFTCADRSENDGGNLPDLGGPKPDSGAPDGGGGTPDAGDMPDGGGGTPDVSADTNPGVDTNNVDTRVDMSVDTSTDRGNDATTSDGIAIDAGCGHENEACCATGTACVFGTTCDPNNACVKCGQRDQLCCTGASACLASNLDCISNVCVCGAQSQVCCGGTTCNSGLTCSGGGDAGGKPTCGCGGNMQACCAGSMCSTSSLNCAGARCTCITGCYGDHYSSDVHVLRSDGTAWYYTGYTAMPVVVADASMQPVTGFTKIATGNQFSCGIKSDKTAWCWWNTSPAGAATYGQLGDGTTNGSRPPVQVVTAVSGPGLSNVIDISTYSNTTCAATGDGYVYCWGYGAYGQLGIGTKPSFSAYAVPVVTAIGGPNFAGADQVTLGPYHTCAHKTDNTVWCWGYNNYGQVGNGNTTEQLLPVNVPGVSNQANQVVAGSNHTCARTGETVWCWGNMSGSLGDGTTTSSPVPIQVLGAAGGTAFAGVAEIRSGSGNVCALKTADKSAWCWGSGSVGGASPVNVAPAGFPVSSVHFWDMQGSNMCFARTDAELYIGGGKVTNLVACP
jgi:hypothetical protein